jgi:hypothetical protein
MAHITRYITLFGMVVTGFWAGHETDQIEPYASFLLALAGFVLTDVYLNKSKKSFDLDKSLFEVFNKMVSFNDIDYLKSHFDSMVSFNNKDLQFLRDYRHANSNPGYTFHSKKMDEMRLALLKSIEVFFDSMSMLVFPVDGSERLHRIETMERSKYKLINDKADDVVAQYGKFIRRAKEERYL